VFFHAFSDYFDAQYVKEK